jgi:hypothetical protein
LQCAEFEWQPATFALEAGYRLGYRSVREPQVVAFILRGLPCVLACVALLVPAASEGRAPGGAVRQLPPALYYWTIERPTQQIPREFDDVHDYIYNPLERTRVLEPVKTAAAYDEDELALWSERGDPVASYLLGALKLGSLTAQNVNDEELHGRLPAALPYFRRAARPASCPGLHDPAARRFLGCKQGLAEAQYILSVCEKYRYAGCQGDLTAARRWCEKSRDQGFTPSDRNCPKPRANEG